MILFSNNALFHWQFAMNLFIFVFQLIFEFIRIHNFEVIFGPQMEPNPGHGKIKSECEYPMILFKFNVISWFFCCFFKIQSLFKSLHFASTKPQIPKKSHMKSYVSPQQNAFGRPFSLKKHEEMFCDSAKTSGFFR